MSRARNLGDIAGLSYISASNNKIGIGTTNPQYTLDVIGDINFNGSLNQNGSSFIASSVAANSVGLGTYTYGDYVKNITGTANQITVTSGTGEGSTPTLSIPNQFTAPQDVEITRDLQVNRNLNVNGSITIGGTAATLFTSELKIYDPDIVLGFRTDAFGNDVSTDNTANHGGIAVASTEGNPLVQLFIAGIETNPATYKKIMWFKAGEFAGLGTDAWLSNYAIGIGSTQVPNGVRLSAGGMQVTDNSISSPQLNISGVSTFTNGPVLVGSGTSTGTASQNLQVTGGAYVSGNLGVGNTNPSYNIHVIGTSDPAGLFFDAYGNVAANIAGRRTNGTLSSPTGVTTNNNLLVLQGGGYTTGSAFADAKVLIAMQAAEVWTSTAQGSHIDFATTLPGTTTRSNKVRIDGYGNVLVGTSSSTGTASQPLQVTGGGYFSGAVGIGYTLPGFNLSVNGSGYFNSTLVAGSKLLVFTQTDTGTASQPLQVNGGAYVSDNLGIGTTNPLQKLHVLGNLLVAAGSSTGQHITQKAYELNSGTLSWEGSAGQLFSITNNLTSGSIFSVNDVSGIPSIDVDANGTIKFAPLGGNVLIGTTSATGTASQRLQVSGGGYFSGNVGIATTNPSERLHVIGNILASGNVTGYSDESLKDNIQTIPNALDKVIQLRGVEYDRKDIEGNPHNIGVIAQEVEKIIPEVVTTQLDGLKSVSYGNLVGLLIEAIKEQQKQIDELKLKLEEK